MESAAKLFVIPADRAPAGPPDAPRELRLEALTRDLLREAARAAVLEQGLLLRSVSFGPDGLVVYAEEPA